MTLITLQYNHYFPISLFREKFKEIFKESYQFIIDENNEVNEISIVYNKRNAVIRYGFIKSEKGDVVYFTEKHNIEELIGVVRDFDYPPKRFVIYTETPFNHSVYEWFEKNHAPEYIRTKVPKGQYVICVKNKKDDIVFQANGTKFIARPDETILSAILKDYPLLKGGESDGTEE